MQDYLYFSTIQYVFSVVVVESLTVFCELILGVIHYMAYVYVK